jgi:hypothetical protein
MLIVNMKRLSCYLLLTSSRYNVKHGKNGKNGKNAKNGKNVFIGPVMFYV